MRRTNALNPSEPEYILLYALEPGVAPVLLEVRNEMQRYIAELLEQSIHEAYLMKRFHYDQYCELCGVDVLDAKLNTIKTVRPGKDWRPFIGEEPKEDT